MNDGGDRWRTSPLLLFHSRALFLPVQTAKCSCFCHRRACQKVLERTPPGKEGKYMWSEGRERRKRGAEPLKRKKQKGKKKLSEKGRRRRRRAKKRREQAEEIFLSTKTPKTQTRILKCFPRSPCTPCPAAARCSPPQGELSLRLLLCRSPGAAKEPPPPRKRQQPSARG